MEYTIDLPNMINISKNKKFSLNLNQYRNAHYFTLSKAKKEFELIVSPLLNNIPKFNECSLTYIFYPKNRVQASDLGNVCPIVGKFFEDTLVNSGHLPDDSPDYIKNITYKFGGFDNANPRTTVIIKGTPMINISLSQVEIEKAILKYISTMYLPQLPKDVQVEIDTQKKDNVVATIIINSDEDTENTTPHTNIKTVTRRKRSTTTAAKKNDTTEETNSNENEDTPKQIVEETPKEYSVKEPENTVESNSLFDQEPSLDMDNDNNLVEETNSDSQGLFSDLVR